MHRRRMFVCVAVFFLVALGFSHGVAEDQLRPTVEAMLLVGQQGAARSTTTRSLLLVGNHLYASGEPGIAAIDVGTPGKLQLASDFIDTSLKVNGAAAKGDVLYVANWSPGAGLLVFDISRPDRPTRKRTIETKAHAWTADVFGDWLYVAIDDGTTTGINTYDIREPASPKLVHFLAMDDRLVGNVARHGDQIYLSHQKWVYIYNVADAAAPRKVGEIEVNGLAGKTLVRDDHLYLVQRKLADGEEGGIFVYSLSDAARPKQVAHWPQEEPRDLCFVGNRAVVPCSGSGVYLLDVRDPERIIQLAHWYNTWPDAGKHGGYPVCAAGAGDYVYLGTTTGNNPECEDQSCKYYGGRVYRVSIAGE